MTKKKSSPLGLSLLENHSHLRPTAPRGFSLRVARGRFYPPDDTSAVTEIQLTTLQTAFFLPPARPPAGVNCHHRKITSNANQNFSTGPKKRVLEPLADRRTKGLSPKSWEAREERLLASRSHRSGGDDNLARRLTGIFSRQTCLNIRRAEEDRRYRRGDVSGGCR